MKSSSSLLVSLSCLAVIGLTACNKSDSSGGGGNPRNPLTPDQKARFDATRRNVSQVSDWQKDGRGGFDYSISSVDLGQGAGNEPGTGPGSSSGPNSIPAKPGKTPQKAQLEKSVTGQCEFETVGGPQNPPPGRGYVPPSEGGDMNPPPMSGTKMTLGMKVKGASCPIRFSWVDSFEQNMDPSSGTFSFKSDFALDYAGLTTEAIAMDIQSFNLTSSVDVKGGHEKMVGTITGKGTILSTAQGKIVIDTNGSVLATEKTGTEATIVTTFTYPDGLVIELKEVDTQVNSKAPQVRKFYVNGEAVDEKTYTEYTKDFGLNKQGSSKKNGNEG